MFAVVRAALEQVTSRFDPALVDADTAQRLLDQVVAIKHMAATAEAGLAARVADSRVWADDGDPSAAHELARRTGTSVGRAKEIVETGRRLRQCPDTAAAAKRGELSPQQTAAITDAASVDPDAEGRLLAQAQRGSLQELRDECAR
ncbi:MAG TPA: DUF222 domain-containing protein, partial [Acidimicrobiia bacterium]|nr:DUF222 domain-containing protein [Acidimicrobiia bacterium]